jgi:GNAT superfamily N-acetyltransferase
MSDYRFEKLNDDNIRHLSEIYKSAYGKEIDISSLMKKFDTSVFGDKNVGFIAFSNATEKPAAFYGVFPCFLLIDGNKIYAAQSGDTMTHKDHQGKGLFVSLAKATYEFAQSRGIKVVFGFPNQNSYPGFVRKLDWQHHEDLLAYVVRAKCIPMIRIKKWFGISNTFHLKIANLILSILKKGKPFKSSVIDEQFGGVDRSDDFIKYKTYSPNHLISFCGKSVWVKPEGMFLKVGDIENCSESDFHKILNRLKVVCFFTGLPYLRFHVSPNTCTERLLIKYGAIKHEQSYPIGYVDFGCNFDMKRVKFTMADNDTF